MHKKLKGFLWNALTARLKECHLLSPDRSTTWRLYREANGGGRIFLTSEYFDIAGGKLVMNFGISSGAYPGRASPLSMCVECPSPVEGFIMVPATALGLRPARLEIELDWQSPTQSMIERLCQVPEAQRLLISLGVTPTKNRHLLSYEIVESFGLEISELDLVDVSERIDTLLTNTVRAVVSPCLDKLREFDLANCCSNA